MCVNALNAEALKAYSEEGHYASLEGEDVSSGCDSHRNFRPVDDIGKAIAPIDLMKIKSFLHLRAWETEGDETHGGYGR